MFNIILVIVSIIVVSVLMVSAIYYGGEIFDGAQDSSVLAREINELAQVKAAAELYHVDFQSKASSMSQLVDNKYLTTAPYFSYDFVPGYVIRKIPANDSNESYCLQFNKKMADIEFIPLCSDSTYSSVSVCCQPSS